MKTMMRSWVVLLWLIGTAFATEYFVATNGNDAAAGTSWATPLMTIKKGVDKAVTAGDVVWVSNGQYQVTSEISYSRGISVKGFGDREDTLVIGGYPASTNRLFYLSHAQAVLDGLTITNGYVANGENYGGGVLSMAGTIRNCVFVGNRGGNGGGGLSCALTLVTNCVFRNNRTQDGDVYGGGGVYIRKSSEMVDCTIVSNQASGGGGVYIAWWDTPALVRNCRIAFNSASTNSDTGGGGVTFGTSTAGMLQDCTVNNNTAKFGGGVSCSKAGCVVTNCLIAENLATIEGGGVSLSAGTVVKCRIIGNQGGVIGNGGGGLKISGGGMVKDSLIALNRGFNYGGGAYFVGAGAFQNCAIVSNSTISSIGDGGGIHSYLGGQGITNCLIAANIAAKYGGGIHFSYTSTVQNCTIYGNITTNSSGTYYGGIRMNAGSLIQNTIVYANTAINYADWFYGIYSNCCTAVTSGMIGAGNIAANPLLRDPAAGDYRLMGQSPCVNAGLYQPWMNTATDLAGKPRLDLRSGIVDIGAYEYLPSGTLIRVN